VKELPGPFDHAYIAKLRPHASSWLVVRKGREERDTLWYCKTGWDQWEAILAEPDTVGLGSNFRTLEVSTAGEVLLLAEFDSNLGYTYDWSYIYRSSDDGRNWELYPMSIKRSGVYYLEDGTGIVLEMVRQAQESKTFGTGLFRSADGWKNHHLEDVFYPTLVNQIATAGRSIYPNAHNAIYRNSTNGINSIIESPTYLPGVKIMTPYPHPIRRGALVTLPLQVSGAERMLHVTVHDVLGRELCLLYDARVSGGRISIPWRVDNLVPGLYILRIQYGDVSVVKPVVVE
jgi:hypothetical protein